MLGFTDGEVQKWVYLEMQKKGIVSGDDEQKVLEWLGKKDKIAGKEMGNMCRLFHIWRDFNPIL